MTHTKTILKSQLPTVMSTPNDAAVLIQRVAQQQVRVISEPDPGVLGELLERVNLRAGPLARDPFPLEVVPDRLAVAPEMPGDRTDRPALLTECCCFNVVLPCEHCGGLLRALE